MKPATLSTSLTPFAIPSFSARLLLFISHEGQPVLSTQRHRCRSMMASPTPSNQNSVVFGKETVFPPSFAHTSHTDKKQHTHPHIYPHAHIHVLFHSFIGFLSLCNLALRSQLFLFLFSLPLLLLPFLDPFVFLVFVSRFFPFFFGSLSLI